MHTFMRTLEIDAPANEVWRVLTTPELVREWAAVYLEGIQIRTSFREGEAVTWKTQSGEPRSWGTVAACRRDRLLRFEYDCDPRGASSETFEISELDHKTRLQLTTGALDRDHFEALKRPTQQVIEEIKSLAEESAQIHGVR
ncbi:SRPBCC domain-containing protein [uncultured Phenylobacterium sp.]|uniref:SRPBCC family protein n=1 Tax=uncultured Phenylobacterium sp. TaxID=349273 RepID=UPI0025DC65D2|nr:SRPBCC domain-containing protein [uncultured Phenylobacterium sp.]